LAEAEGITALKPRALREAGTHRAAKIGLFQQWKDNKQAAVLLARLGPIALTTIFFFFAYLTIRVESLFLSFII
jgi:hypothetical protein